MSNLNAVDAFEDTFKDNDHTAQAEYDALRAGPDGDKFWVKARPVLRGGCFHWDAGATGSGYGAVWWNGKRQGAHRVAYELAKGPVPEGLVVAHLCDRPLCVRPSHLEAMTQFENMAAAEKRVELGKEYEKDLAEIDGSVSEDEKQAIRSSTAIGIATLAGLSEQFGMSVNTIKRISASDPVLAATVTGADE